MHAPLPSLTLPARVLFLSRRESAVRTDATALRSLGVASISHICNSDKAVAFLEAELGGRQKIVNETNISANAVPCVDLVISDESLEDVTAFAFLHRMAQNPLLQTQPVLVLTSSVNSSRLFRSAGAYVLERPYTISQMTRMLSKALSSTHRTLRSTSFEQVATAKAPDLLHKGPKTTVKKAPALMTTSDWFKKALRHLQDNELNPAEHAFSQVLNRQEDHIDASLGMARVLRCRGDEPGMRRFLLRSAAACLREGNKGKAANIAELLPIGMRNNIYVHEAIARMEEGEFRAAALGFLDASRETPEVPLHSIMARACQLTPDPEEKLRSLCTAYEGMGHHATAKKIRQRLLNYPLFETGTPPPHWLDNYPKVKEAVSIATYAAWAWRHA